MRPIALTILAPVIQPLNALVRAPGPTQLWIVIFIVWSISLSGLVGVPGILQSLRLKSLLNSKQTQMNELQTELIRLQDEALGLEKNKVLQQREIRRVLGYSAPDELIFDFTPQQELLNP